MQTRYGSLLLTLMLMGSLAGAGETGRGPKHAREETRRQMKTELNLTKEQEKKLEIHRIDQRAEMEKHALVIKEKREALKTALEDPQLNRGAIDRMNDELKDAQNEMADKRLEGILYMREVLTPEQFKKFLALRPARGENDDRHGKCEKKSRNGSRNRHEEFEEDHGLMDDAMDMSKDR